MSDSIGSRKKRNMRLRSLGVDRDVTLVFWVPQRFGKR